MKDRECDRKREREREAQRELGVLVGVWYCRAYVHPFSFQARSPSLCKLQNPPVNYL